MKEYVFGIDLGGTTAKIGLFKTTGEMMEKWEVPTDTSDSGQHILPNLAASIKAKMAETGIPAEQVEGVGIGGNIGSAIFWMLFPMQPAPWRLMSMPRPL